MNIQAIKRNCMARCMALLLTNPSGEQWVFNGQTGYPVEGLRLDAEGLEALFNLSVKQRDKMLIAEKPNDDKRFSTLRDAEKIQEIAGRMAAPGYRWPDDERDAADAEAEAERIAEEMGME